MAKVSMVERERKRTKLVARYARKRAELKAIIKSPSSSEEERAAAVDQLSQVPRNASPTRQRNRCRDSRRPASTGPAPWPLSIR